MLLPNAALAFKRRGCQTGSSQDPLATVGSKLRTPCGHARCGRESPAVGLQLPSPRRECVLDNMGLCKGHNLNVVCQLTNVVMGLRTHLSYIAENDVAACTLFGATPFAALGGAPFGSLGQTTPATLGLPTRAVTVRSRRRRKRDDGRGGGGVLIQ